MKSNSVSGMENAVINWIDNYYDLKGKVTRLEGYEDINFLLQTFDNRRFVIKISDNLESIEAIQAQIKMLQYLQKHSKDAAAFPKIAAGKDGLYIFRVRYEGRDHWIRVLSYLGGTLWHQVNPGTKLLKDLGRFLGVLNNTLLPCDLPEFRSKESLWDLKNAGRCIAYCKEIKDPHYRRMVRYFLQQYEQKVVSNFGQMKQGLIHGDANDHNILVSDNRVSGLIDFGDSTYSYLVNELAIAMTYAMMDSKEPVKVAKLIALGYYNEQKLSPVELDALYYLIAARLCTSICISSYSQQEDPSNEYLSLHQDSVKKLLDKLISISPLEFTRQIKHGCSIETEPQPDLDTLKFERSRYFSDTMTLSYQKPIIMTQGALQYLYDSSGNTYLDAVNNISHVGHCHPVIVSAAENQMMELNTNTRYFYPQLNQYAQMLVALLPEPLSVVFLVNSGTEANELALRLARAHTGHNDMLVIEHAYHGNSASTLEVSPYKYRGKGGMGASPTIHEVLSPDLYRGSFRREDPEALKKYLDRQLSQIESIVTNTEGLAGFIGESILGCGGQIVLPDGYLKNTYQQVRAYGGVCIADEVQVGFGRVGSNFWAFQTQGVVPDIVTMGKPMGNGHPLAAVVTNREIAESFNTGMEYFNSFGGNPVSCEIGKAVLNTIREERLQENALVVGNHLKSGLEHLQSRHKEMGDVRGLGLFLGIELVTNRETKEPAAGLATKIVENMKQRGILISVDGPLKNVLKIKPPLIFSMDNANHFLEQLDQTLTQDCAS